MRAGCGASIRGSIHTFPVNQSSGPSCPAGLSRDSAETTDAVAEEAADACVPTRFISMLSLSTPYGSVAMRELMTSD
jgi:hypothetical protein